MTTLIVCDIQPEYASYMPFNVYNFVKYLNRVVNRYNNVVYFYNGSETVGGVTEYELIDWLLDAGLREELLNSIKFFDKGYGFLRSAIDNNIDDRLIISTLRKMDSLGVTDSRYLSPRHKLACEDYTIWLNDSIDVMKQFDYIRFVGGGVNECLKELILGCKAFKIKHTLKRKYVY